MLEKVNLTEEALNYIKQELSLGGILSTQISQISLSVGNIFTYLPPEFTLPTPVDFAESLEFLTGENVSNEFESLIIDIITSYLDNTLTKIVLFETMWEDTDPVTLRTPLQYLIINGRRYDYLTGDDKKESILDYLSDAKGYPTVISIIDLGDSRLQIKDKGKIKEGDVNELVSKIEGLIIGAFDGEGYLIWQKNL